jgi:hypothetical protein
MAKLKSLTLDYSNSLECQCLNPIAYWAESGVNVVHLAGRDHGKLVDFAEISEFVWANPKSTDIRFITEFTQLALKDRIEQTLMLQHQLWN